MSTKASQFLDPFKEDRAKKGLFEMNDHGEAVHMVLGLNDVRTCAKNWETFSSGKAVPGRIVVPSEEDIRTVRQIPVEVDPPVHTDFRNLLNTWFKRPLQPTYKEALTDITGELVESVAGLEQFEVVHEFALILQSRALTLLLNTSMEESETWISWGTHVFRTEEEALDGEKSGGLDVYIHEKIDLAIEEPGEDLYSVLLASEVGSRKLTREEVHGIINLSFAGGRDTVINTISNSIAYLAEHPDQFKRLQAEPRLIPLAIEELIRYFSPLTHLGRVTTQEVEVCSHTFKQDQKVSLGWASANRDESVFENPDEIKLDRKKNPHVGFGHGIHQCLGATHARQVLKTFLEVLLDKVDHITLQGYEDKFESLGPLRRKVGFEKLNATFHVKRAR